jgi:hypothetical protein
MLAEALEPSPDFGGFSEASKQTSHFKTMIFNMIGRADDDLIDSDACSMGLKDPIHDI